MWGDCFIVSLGCFLGWMLVVLWFRVVCVLLCGVCLVIDIRLLLIVLNTSPIGCLFGWFCCDLCCHG